MIKSFLIALQFLTVVPIKVSRVNSKELAGSAAFFPLVGLLLAMLLIGINNALSSLTVLRLSQDIILVVALVFLTGGLHLDGLSDTSDALLSRKPKEEMLNIMRDSHAGVMGVLSVTSVLLLKISFLYSINPLLKPAAILLMCVLGRWAMAFSMYLSPYARETGKAKDFIEGMNLRVIIFSSLIAFICSAFIWQFKGLSVLIVTGVFVWLGSKYLQKKLGGITGDTIGAVNELTEVLVLLVICLFGSLHA